MALVDFSYSGPLSSPKVETRRQISVHFFVSVCCLSSRGPSGGRANATGINDHWSPHAFFFGSHHLIYFLTVPPALHLMCWEWTGKQKANFIWQWMCGKKTQIVALLEPKGRAPLRDSVSLSSFTSLDFRGYCVCTLFMKRKSMLKPR